MARPLKPGLDYFSHDVDMSSDPKLELLEAKQGLIGYAVYCKLLEKIYRNGYYLEWGDDTALIFSKRVNVDINTLSAIVNDSINVGLFHEKLFQSHSILTSHGIQSRYLKGCVRRKAAYFIQEYILLDVNDHDNDKLEVVIVDINSGSTVVNVRKSTQSKGKRKESKKKGNKSKAATDASPPHTTEAKKIIKYLAQVSGKTIRETAAGNLEPTIARLNEGYTWDNFKAVIDHFCEDWKPPKVFHNDNGTTTPAHTYLRPTTLFNRQFDNKLNIALSAGKNGKVNEVQKEELTAILTESVNQESEEAMWNHLKASNIKLYRVARARRPFLFENRNSDFPGIISSYQDEL